MFYNNDSLYSVSLSSLISFLLGEEVWGSKSWAVFSTWWRQVVGLTLSSTDCGIMETKDSCCTRPPKSQTFKQLWAVWGIQRNIFCRYRFHVGEGCDPTCCRKWRLCLQNTGRDIKYILCNGATWIRSRRGGRSEFHRDGILCRWLHLRLSSTFLYIIHDGSVAAASWKCSTAEISGKNGDECK